MTQWEKIVSDKALSTVKTLRSKTYITSKERSSCLQELLDEGWSVNKEYKNPKYIGVRKDKPLDEQFEDKVWLLFANMGFIGLNSDRSFKMQYSLEGKVLTKQIDVFAVDDETIIFVECKAAQTLKDGNFKTDIEAYAGIIPGLRIEALAKYPGRKVKFIWATSNYAMSQADIDRLEEYKILHFSDEVIGYYSELTKHLGSCAKYQLLGNLFAGQKIKNMESQIPAIQGKMGGHTYYSFSIEPERLLKIGYVLHRSEANRNLMPTYQRLIKKDRLSNVRKFIINRGYFPNSLIISIDTEGKDIRFDRASNQVEDSISTIGILYLPQQYRSAYIIDGQHRLYGYSDSPYAAKNTVPVVAFVNLAREEQIRLFMEINENQKAVSKTLRNTLNADMLWSSDDFNKRRQALMLHIAECLGDEPSSPLFGRIIVGEEDKSSTRCITNEIIRLALKNSNFFSSFGKNNAIVKDGTFDAGTNDSTKDIFYPFLKECLLYFKNYLPEEWNKGESDNGILTINIGIYSIIRIISDIIDHLVSSDGKNPKKVKTSNLVNDMKYYLDPLVDFYNNISVEERTKIKSSYGGSAQTKYWRTLQKAIHDVRPEFTPDGMEAWWLNNAKIFNDESFKLIREIALQLNRIFADKLEKYHGTNWQITGIPKSVYTRAKHEADDRNYERLIHGDGGEDISLWSYVTIADYKEIATYGRNWSEIFESILVRPEDRKISGGKARKIEWLTQLSTILNKSAKPSYSVTKDEYDLIMHIHKWLIS